MTEEVQRDSFDPETATEDQVLQWLAVALLAYKENQSRWAFGPLALRMGHRDDVAHDLRGVYDTLSEEAQERWRTAVVGLVPEVAHEPELAVIAIDLAALIGASNVFGALLPIVAAEPSPPGLLLNRIVDAAFESPGDPALAVRCLYAAAEAAEFRPASAGLALMALCRLAPDGWVDHAEHLTPAMEALLSGLDADSTPLRRYGRKVVAAVTLERLAQGWPTLAANSSLQWLQDALTGGPEPLLLERDGALSLAEAPDHRVAVSAPAREPLSGIEQLSHTAFRRFLETEHAREATLQGLADPWVLHQSTASPKSWISNPKRESPTAQAHRQLVAGFLPTDGGSFLITKGATRSLLQGHLEQWADPSVDVDWIEGLWPPTLIGPRGKVAGTGEEAEPGADELATEFRNLFSKNKRMRGPGSVPRHAVDQPFVATSQIMTVAQSMHFEGTE